MASYAYPKPVFHHDDLTDWFANNVRSLETLKVLNTQVSERFRTLEKIKREIEEKLVPKMLREIMIWPDNALFPDSSHGKLAVQFTGELYSILAVLQDCFDYLWTGNRICLKNGSKLYKKDTAFKMGDSSDDMSHASLAGVQAMAQAFSRRNKKGMEKDDIRAMRKICDDMENFIQSYHDWFHHPNIDRHSSSHFGRAQIQIVVKEICKKFKNIFMDSEGRHFKFSCEGNSSVRFFGDDQLGHYNYKTPSLSAKIKKKPISKIDYPRVLKTFNNICIVNENLVGDSIELFSIERLDSATTINKKEKENEVILGTKRSLDRIQSTENKESNHSQKKRAYEIPIELMNTKGEDVVVADNSSIMDVDSDEETKENDDVSSGRSPNESSMKISTTTQSIKQEENSIDVEVDNMKSSNALDAEDGDADNKSALNNFKEVIKLSALDIINAKKKIEIASSTFVEFLIERLKASNNTMSASTKAEGVFSILLALYRDVRDQLLGELDQRQIGDDTVCMGFLVSFRDRKNKNGDPDSNKRVASTRDVNKIYKTLADIFLDIGNFMWNAIHYPLMAVEDAPLLREVENEKFKTDPSQTRTVMTLYFSGESFEDISLLSLMLSRGIGSKGNVTHEGIFDGILTAKEDDRQNAYHKNLLLAAEVLNGRKGPKKKKKKPLMDDFSKSINQARSSTAKQEKENKINLNEKNTNNCQLYPVVISADQQESNGLLTLEGIEGVAPLIGISIEDAINTLHMSGICDHENKGRITVKSETSKGDSSLPVVLMTYAKEFFSSQDSTARNSTEFFYQVADILKTYGLFSWELPYNGELSSETPSNGFCFYLLHAQVVMYLDGYDKDNFPKIDGNYVYGDFFRDQLKREISYLLSLPYLKKTYKQDTDELLDKLNKVLEFVSDEINRKEQKSLSNLLWGSNFIVGPLFLMKKEESFSFYHRSTDAKNTGFMQLWNVSGRGIAYNPYPVNGFFRYSELEHISSICQTNKYVGCFNVSGAHFHPVYVDQSAMGKSMETAFKNCCKLVASTLQYIVVHKYQHLSKSVAIQIRGSRDVMDLIENDDEELDVSREQKSTNISEDLLSSIKNVQHCFQLFKQSNTYNEYLSQLNSSNPVLYSLIKSVQQMESLCPNYLVPNRAIPRKIPAVDDDQSNDDVNYYNDDDETNESKDF